MSEKRQRIGLLGAFLLLAVAFSIVHLALGSGLPIPTSDFFHALLAGPNGGKPGSTAGFVIWSLRMPRVAGCLLIGAILGTVGSCFQALFRNPLAEPYIIGASSGAALGGVIVLILGFGDALFGLGVPLGGFIGGMATLGFVILLSRNGGRWDSQMLLLSGVAVSSLLSALMSFALYKAGQDTTVILRWLLGSTDPMFWSRIWMMAITLVVSLTLLLPEAKNLNALAISEATAAHLGVNVKVLRFKILVLGVAMTATAVGSAGIIGFVGLVAPHLARRSLGTDWRFSLVGSALIGCCLLQFADTIAQRALSDGLPVGIVTAIIGSPALLLLLRQRSRKVSSLA